MPSEQRQPRIKVACPHCGAKASAPAEFAGRRVKCARAECRRSFDLPSPEPEVPVPVVAASENVFLSTPEPLPEQFATGPAVASNPGQIPFNPLVYWRHQPLGIALGGGFAIVVFLIWLGLTLSGAKATIPTKKGGETPIWLFSAASLATVGYFTWAASRKFRSGDANPGVVVSLSPTLVAVPTDLTQGIGEYPAVKIIKINLTETGGKPIEVGSVVPTVSLYAQAHNKQAGHWSDFYPEPAEYATNNNRVVERLCASFSPDQFAFLQQALAVIEKPLKPGLYAMWNAPGKPAGRRIEKKTDF